MLTIVTIIVIEMLATRRYMITEKLHLETVLLHS